MKICIGGSRNGMQLDNLGYAAMFMASYDQVGSNFFLVTVNRETNE